MSASDAPPPRRTRTEAQMAQKRRADRLKHKVNRAESKSRLETIERDVAYLRDTLGELVMHLRPGANHNLNVAPGSVGSAASSSSPFALDPRAWSSSSSSSPPTNGLFPFTSNTRNATGNVSGQSNILQEAMNRQFTKQYDTPFATSSGGLTVECRCGVHHNDRSDCLEFSSFMVLYQANVAISQDPNLAVCIPRNPTLSNLMLHSVQDNPLTMILGSTLRQFQVGNTEALFGLYFLAYRLLRWRIYPNDESFSDVPALMHPTDIQNSHPHPVCVDFLPWPGLRNYLCLNQNKDSRHSVALFIQSICLDWPSDKLLMCRSFCGDVALSPDFEHIVSDLRNWRITSPFAETFPELVKFAHC